MSFYNAIARSEAFGVEAMFNREPLSVECLELKLQLNQYTDVRVFRCPAVEENHLIVRGYSTCGAPLSMKLETSALSTMQEKAHSIAVQLIEGQDFVSSITQQKYL